MKLHLELEQVFWNLENFVNFNLFFCFNPDMRLARQRWLFSGNLPAMFIRVVSKCFHIHSLSFRVSFFCFTAINSLNFVSGRFLLCFLISSPYFLWKWRHTHLNELIAHYFLQFFNIRLCVASLFTPIRASYLVCSFWWIIFHCPPLKGF